MAKAGPGSLMGGFDPDVMSWRKADAVRVKDNDERTLLMLAGPVFRARFGHQWPCDVEENDDDD